jgi:glycosyltransferase involved in cell wall biosynthesis
MNGEIALTAQLSVLLPVCNAQAGLENQVERVMDLLPELADRFHVVIVDDGSTDDTHEVARDLARRYPQIEVVRHPVSLGVDEAIETGLGCTQSDVVLVHSGAEAFDAAQANAALRSATRPGLAPRSAAATILHLDKNIRRADGKKPVRVRV